MKICYTSATYLSHSNAADMYRELLAQTHELVPESEYESADVMVLHHEPKMYRQIYAAFPAVKRKFVVGYAVWETTELPASYQQGVPYVQEIWTCSRFCVEAFSRHHERVTLIPHVMARDTSCTDADRTFVREAIGYEPGRMYYLTITRFGDPRKNADQLIAAFLHQAGAMPEARLIVKVPRGDTVPVSDHPQVRFVGHVWTHAQINALYELADVYVSAHHSEGWGLTLSDAMMFGVPVLATGYSGNMEFMTADNSWPVAFTEEHIRPEDCCRQFDRTMKWAYPSQDDLERQLVTLYHSRRSDAVERKVRQATADAGRFSRHAVRDLMLTRLDAIAACLA
jgi:glycosyltransferase involved in cell wall biosynthesis